MFKNVLLGFSLLCGFLLPNHINAYSTLIPTVYSWETGDSDASAIVMPPLPDGYTYGNINSVAINAAGNAVMVGDAENDDGTAQIPLAYSWTTGDAEATQITTPLPTGYTYANISSVAINAAGNAVMVGWARNADFTAHILLAYSWTNGDTAATRITFPALPAGYEKGVLRSVAINDDGNAVMGGEAENDDFTAQILLAYSWTNGDTAATRITMPFPTGYTNGEIDSVAINDDGNAVIVGQAWKIDIDFPVAYIPLAYSWTGAAAATQITTDLPAEGPAGGLSSVAINAAGKAVMVGWAVDDAGKVSTKRFPLVYSWTAGEAKATRITAALPAGDAKGSLTSVAINADGNAVMGGVTAKFRYGASPREPLAYSLALGATEATQITVEPPAESTGVLLVSVAIDTAGNAVMAGHADITISGSTKTIPLAYSWNTGDASAIETPPPYPEYPIGYLYSVAITADGKAIMGGYSYYVTPNTGGAFPGGAFPGGAFQQ